MVTGFDGDFLTKSSCSFGYPLPGSVCNVMFRNCSRVRKAAVLGPFASR